MLAGTACSSVICSMESIRTESAGFLQEHEISYKRLLRWENMLSTHCEPIQFVQIEPIQKEYMVDDQIEIIMSTEGCRYAIARRHAQSVPQRSGGRIISLRIQRSTRNAALLHSKLSTYALSDIQSNQNLNDVLDKLMRDWATKSIDNLLPDCWKILFDPNQNPHRAIHSRRLIFIHFQRIRHHHCRNPVYSCVC